MVGGLRNALLLLLFIVLLVDPKNPLITFPLTNGGLCQFYRSAQRMTREHSFREDEGDASSSCSFPAKISQLK